MDVYFSPVFELIFFYDMAETYLLRSTSRDPILKVFAANENESASSHNSGLLEQINKSSSAGRK